MSSERAHMLEYNRVRESVPEVELPLWEDLPEADKRIVRAANEAYWKETLNNIERIINQKVKKK